MYPSSNRKTIILIIYLIIFVIPTYTIQGQLLPNLQNNIKKQSQEDNVQNIVQAPDKLIFLQDIQFIGTYTRTRQQNLFDYLNSQTGTIQAILFRSPFIDSPYQINKFQMLLFDPVYHDQRAVRVSIVLQKMAGNNQWNSSNSQVQVQAFWKQRIDFQKNQTNVTYRIILLHTQNSNPTEVQFQLYFFGVDFQFHAKLGYDDNRLSTLGYCLYTSFAVLIQIISAYYLLKKIDTTHPNIVNKISLTVMAICNIEDFYLTMINIQYIMTSRSTTYLFYIMPSLCYITLFVVFDMKLLFLAWRSHYIRQIDNPQALRKKLTTFYIKFYVGLFLYLTFTYFFSFDAWMIILQNLILVPQIVHNVRIGINPGFQPLYVFGYLGARFLMPLYQRACPNNHFLLIPMVGLVITLFILYILQILILFLQNLLGPRFFVPKIFLPNYYNYNFKIKPSEQNKDLQCSICLQSFFVDTTDLNINSTQIQQSILKERTVMRTPCNHYFHRDCLVNWTDVKLQCPTCRAPLPPV